MYPARRGGRLLGLYLIVRPKHRPVGLEDFIERELDSFLRRHNLLIVSYEVVSID